MHNFTLIQWNIAGLTTKIQELANLIEKYQPTVICLQETNINCHRTKDTLTINGYILYNHNTRSENRGGIGILIKDNIPHTIKTHNTKNLSMTISLYNSKSTYTIFT